MINPFFCKAFDTVLNKSLADRSCQASEEKAIGTGYEREGWKAKNNPHGEGDRENGSYRFLLIFFVSKHREHGINVVSCSLGQRNLRNRKNLTNIARQNYHIQILQMTWKTYWSKCAVFLHYVIFPSWREFNYGYAFFNIRKDFKLIYCAK